MIDRIAASRLWDWLAALLAAGVVWLMVLFFAGAVGAHTAPSGWDYPGGCCSGVHCSPLPADEVRRTDEGYLIVPTGELIPYAAANSSPDGEYHYCTVRDRHPPPGVFEWGRVRETDRLHKDSGRPHPALNRARTCFWAPEVGS